MVEAEPRRWSVLTASWGPRFAIELLFVNSVLHKPTPPGVCWSAAPCGSQKEVSELICPLGSSSALPPPLCCLEPELLALLLSIGKCTTSATRGTAGFVFLTSLYPSAARTSVSFSHPRANRKRVPTEAGFAETQGKGHVRSCGHAPARGHSALAPAWHVVRQDYPWSTAPSLGVLSPWEPRVLKSFPSTLP